MLQKTSLGASLKRGWTDSIHDAHLLLLNLDFLHQRPNHFPSRLPARLLQFLGNASGELLQLSDDQSEFRLLRRLADPLPTVILQLGYALRAAKILGSNSDLSSSPSP